MGLKVEKVTGKKNTKMEKDNEKKKTNKHFLIFSTIFSHTLFNIPYLRYIPFNYSIKNDYYKEYNIS